MTEIDEGSQQYGHREFVDVVGDADGDDLIRGEHAVECDEEHDKTIDQLRHQCRARRPHPEPFVARSAAQLLKDEYIHKLPDEECRERTHDDPQSLTEDLVEGDIHIVNAAVLVCELRPPGGGWQFDS